MRIDFKMIFASITEEWISKVGLCVASKTTSRKTWKEQKWLYWMCWNFQEWLLTSLSTNEILFQNDIASITEKWIFKDGLCLLTKTASRKMLIEQNWLYWICWNFRKWLLTPLFINEFWFENYICSHHREIDF